MSALKCRDLAPDPDLIPEGAYVTDWVAGCANYVLRKSEHKKSLRPDANSSRPITAEYE